MKQSFQFIRKSLYLASGIGTCIFGLSYYCQIQLKQTVYSAPECSVPSFKDIKRCSATISDEAALRKEFEENNFSFHKEEGLQYGYFFHEPYFITDSYYLISSKYASKLIDATYTCYNMLLRTTDYVINENPQIMNFLNIPPSLQPIIKASWNQQLGKDIDLVGRFDFLVNELQEIKLLEFNGDTALLLIESGIAQQLYKKHYEKTNKDLELSQFNMIDSLLPKCWKNIFQNTIPLSNQLNLMGHFDVPEEKATLQYLSSTAKYYFNPQILDIKDVQYENKELKFQSGQIKLLLKLYPYEWMTDEINELFEDFQNDFRHHYQFIEPPWKLVMSNKGLLPIMNKLYPNNEYLLKSEFSLKNLKRISHEPYVSKRFYGREGHSVLYSKDFSSEEDFQKESYKPMENEDGHFINIGGPIFQEFFQTPLYNGRGITIGSWVVQGVPACFGIREDNKGKTDNQSCFVPHFVENLKTKQTLYLSEKEELLRTKIYGQSHLSELLKNEEVQFQEVVKKTYENPNATDEINEIVEDGDRDSKYYHQFWPMPIQQKDSGYQRSRTGLRSRTLGRIFRYYTGG